MSKLNIKDETLVKKILKLFSEYNLEYLDASILCYSIMIAIACHDEETKRRIEIIMKVYPYSSYKSGMRI